jgi:hypothetical protein
MEEKSGRFVVALRRGVAEEEWESEGEATGVLL